MRQGQKQMKSYRFLMTFTDEQGVEQTQKFLNYQDVFEATGIARASFFKMLRGVIVPKYKNYNFTSIRAPAYKITKVLIE